MQVTTANYSQVLPTLPFNDMPDAVKKGVETINKYTQSGADWSAYQSNENVKRIVDMIFNKIEPYVPAQKKAAAPKYVRPVSQSATVKKALAMRKAAEKVADVVESGHSPQPKAAKVKQPKAAKAPKAAAAPSGTAVEKISASIGFIKRMLNYNGKKIEKAKLVSMLRSLQKAIVERVIRKEDAFAKEIREIQEYLVAASQLKEHTIAVVISDKKVEAYTKAIGSESKMAVIELLKSYIKLVGKEGVKDKAKNLIKRIYKVIESGAVSEKQPRFKLLVSAGENIESYLANDTKVIVTTEAELNGLAGLGCCDMGTIVKIKQKLHRTKDRNYTTAKGKGAGSHHGGIAGHKSGKKKSKILRASL